MESFSEEDVSFMQLAVGEARLALAAGETPVGCVIVRDGLVVGRGHNMTNASKNGTRHAEMIAIDEILNKDEAAPGGPPSPPTDFAGCTLYVTCEPCIMCAGALSLLEFRKVFYGCANDKFGGNGSILSIHLGGRAGCGMNGRKLGTYPSVGGLMKEDAIRLLQEFYISGNPSAPVPHRPVDPDAASNGSRAYRLGREAKRKKA